MSIPTMVHEFEIEEVDSVYPFRKYLKMREEQGDLVQESEHHFIALGYDLVNEILRSDDFIAMNPVDNGVNRALAGRNRYIQAFMRPFMKVILRRHKFLSMVKLWLALNNPPTHYRLRKISKAAFTPGAIKGLTPKISKVTNELLDELEGKEEIDLMKEFALPLPVAMIAAIIGIPDDGAEKFNGWSQSILNGLNQTPGSMDDVKAAMKAQDEIKEYFSAIIKEREVTPEDDVISLMLQARDSDDKEMYMTDDEIIANLILLLIAGHETTVNLIGNTMYALLTNPDQYEQIKQNHDLLDNAIEESLRFDTPISIIVRVAARDIEIAKKQVKKGDLITIMLYAANLDERQFDNATTFDINRDNAKRHVSFGQGIHFCLGAPLARAEAKIAFTEIMKRFPNMQLVGDKPDRTEVSAFNGFSQLRVKLK